MIGVTKRSHFTLPSQLSSSNDRECVGWISLRTISFMSCAHRAAHLRCEIQPNGWWVLVLVVSQRMIHRFTADPERESFIPPVFRFHPNASTTYFTCADMMGSLASNIPWKQATFIFFGFRANLNRSSTRGMSWCTLLNDGVLSLRTHTQHRLLMSKQVLQLIYWKSTKTDQGERCLSDVDEDGGNTERIFAIRSQRKMINCV